MPPIAQADNYNHQAMRPLQGDFMQAAAAGGVGAVAGGFLAGGAAVIVAASGPIVWTAAGIGAGLMSLVAALNSYLTSGTDAARRHVDQTENTLRQDIGRASENALTPIVETIEAERDAFKQVQSEDKHQDLHLLALVRRLSLGLSRRNQPSMASWLASSCTQVVAFERALQVHDQAWFNYKSQHAQITRLEQGVRMMASTMRQAQLEGLIAQLTVIAEQEHYPLSRAACLRALIYSHECYYTFVRDRVPAQGTHLPRPPGPRHSEGVALDGGI